MLKKCASVSVTLQLLAFFSLAAPSANAKTHCYWITGEGANLDRKYLDASPLVRSSPLKDKCIQFATWSELFKHYQIASPTYDESDQIFISQAVHGITGGRAWDREGTVAFDKYNDNVTIDELGGTSPSIIVDMIKTIARRHRVGYHNLSCHGGSLITRYVQQLDAQASIDETESRICMMSESIQGSVTFVGSSETRPAISIGGMSMSEVFRSTYPDSSKVVAGLISAAKMTVLPDSEAWITHWEGDQLPMVIHHQGRNGRTRTGAFQACNFDYLEVRSGYKPNPVWGLDWYTEQVYRELSKRDQEVINDCSIVHKASVESLDLPLEVLTEKQRLRRKACDEFRF